MSLDHAIARQRAGGPPAPASVYGSVAVTVFCWRDGVIARNRTYAREMTLGLASLAGEESRLLLELMFDAEGSLIDIAFEWLRPDSIDAADRPRIDELAEATYRLRVAAEGKIGRNAPCPCGSGQKYKKCHGS